MINRHDETLRLTPVTCNLPTLDPKRWDLIQTELPIKQDVIDAFLIRSGMRLQPPVPLGAVR